MFMMSQFLRVRSLEAGGSGSGFLVKLQSSCQLVLRPSGRAGGSVSKKLRRTALGRRPRSCLTAAAGPQFLTPWCSPSAAGCLAPAYPRASDSRATSPRLTGCPEKPSLHCSRGCLSVAAVTSASSPEPSNTRLKNNNNKFLKIRCIGSPACPRHGRGHQLRAYHPGLKGEGSCGGGREWEGCTCE